MVLPATKEQEADVQIHLHDQGNLPLYLQIKYQLSHQISSQRLPSGSRLPTVRELAQRLRVNPNTVALAYRELQADGLVEAYPRRGTFVRVFNDGARGEGERHAHLTDTLRQAYRHARALGFTEAEIAQRFLSLASAAPIPVPLVFVDQTADVVSKYGGLLEHHLGEEVRVSGLTLDRLERADPALRDRLEGVYYVLAFPRNVPALNRLLPAVLDAFDVVTVASEPLPETIAALRTLPADTRAVLLSEERFLNPSLNLIQAYTSFDPAKVPAFTGSDPEGLSGASAKADLVIYTYTASPWLAQLDPRVPTLELQYDLSPASVDELRRRLGLKLT